MTTRLTRLLVLTLPAVLSGALLAMTPTYAGTGGAKGDPSTDPVRSQRLVVKWDGARKRQRYEKRASVPGIGTVGLVCRPNSTMIEIRPYDRSAETQMWLAKYQDTDGDERADSVAVKNVRVYRYATAADDGTGGTGATAHEGLNRQGRIENRSAGGYAYGIISQRPGRERDAARAAPPPTTSFYLTWFWNGFDYDQPYRSCKMVLRLRTSDSAAVAVNWHGDDDAATGPTTGSATDGTTTFTATCRSKAQGGSRTLAIAPSDASVYVEEISGEGSTGDHVEAYTQPADPVEHVIDGITLPRNGMLRLRYDDQWWLLSSYVAINNDAKPYLNLCEVAAAPLP